VRREAQENSQSQSSSNVSSGEDDPNRSSQGRARAARTIGSPMSMAPKGSAASRPQGQPRICARPDRRRSGAKAVFDPGPEWTLTPIAFAGAPSAEGRWPFAYAMRSGGQRTGNALRREASHPKPSARCPRRCKGRSVSGTRTVESAPKGQFDAWRTKDHVGIGAGRFCAGER
jgi:hypothetical protein